MSYTYHTFVYETEELHAVVTSIYTYVHVLSVDTIHGLLY